MLVLQRMTHTEPAYEPPTWSNGTDAAIVDALSRHYAGEIDLHDYWSVGDARTVQLSAMPATGVSESHTAQSVRFVLTEVGGITLSGSNKECAFQVDLMNALAETGNMHNTDSDTSIVWSNCNRRTWCNTVFRESIPSTIRDIFKQFKNVYGTSLNSTSTVDDYFSLRSTVELYNNESSSSSGGFNLNEGSFINYYETSINRDKGMSYWLRSSWFKPTMDASRMGGYTFSSNRALGIPISRTDFGIAPFGVI